MLNYDRFNSHAIDATLSLSNCVCLIAWSFFSAQAKTTVTLGALPVRDAAEVERRQAANRAWTASPPAEQVNVRLRIPFDSHVLGGTGPLQNYPELRGRPTIVAHPLTKIDGVELATIEPIGAIAKGLVAGERQELGKKKKGGD